MVTILAGSMNSGKTTDLLTHFRHQAQGDGFAALKIMEGKQVLSYDAMRLSDGKRMCLAKHRENTGFVCPDGQNIGPYVLIPETLQEINHVIDELILMKIAPIYFDEIGMLEIRGGGFDKALRKAIDSGLDVVLTTRTDLKDQVVRRYKIKDVSVIEV